MSEEDQIALKRLVEDAGFLLNSLEEEASVGNMEEARNAVEQLPGQIHGLERLLEGQSNFGVYADA